MTTPNTIDFFDLEGAAFNGNPIPLDATGAPIINMQDVPGDAPVIELGALDRTIGTIAENADVGGPEVFFRPSDGAIVNASGNVIITPRVFDELDRAMNELPPLGEAPGPGVVDRLLKALGPINDALGTPLGKTLAVLGLSGLGSVIGAAAASGPSAGEALQRLAAQGVTLPPSVAAGQQALTSALANGGAASLDAATRDALAAQAGGADYLKNLIATESGYDATELPQLAAIRQGAIADLPGSTSISPADRPALYAPLVARMAALLNEPQSLTDPVSSSLSREVAGMINGQYPAVAAPRTNAGASSIGQWVSQPDTAPNEFWHVVSGTNGDAAGDLIRAGWTPQQVATWLHGRAPESEIQAFLTGASAPPKTKMVFQPASPASLGNVINDVAPDDPRVTGAQTIYSYQDGTSALRAADGTEYIYNPQTRTLASNFGVGAQTATPAVASPGAPAVNSQSALVPLEDSVQAGLNTELGRAFEGKVANATLERKIATDREALVNTLAHQLGTNTPELTSAGAKRLAEFDFQAEAMRENDRRAVIATYAPLEQSRRQFNVTFPESRYQTRLGQLLPAEQARTQFNYQAPRVLRNAELGTVGTLANAAEAQSTQRQTNRFAQDTILSTMGRRPVIPAVAAAGGIMPAASLTGTGAATNAATTNFQTSVAAANAAATERANTAAQIARLFSSAATAGIGRT